MVKKVNFQIGRKIGFPFLVFLFCILGVLLGISLFRIHAIFALMIGYVLLFPAFYYGQRIFELWYYKDRIGFFLGTNGMTMILTSVSMVWYYILKRRDWLKPTRETQLWNLDRNIFTGRPSYF